MRHETAMFGPKNQKFQLSFLGGLLLLLKYKDTIISRNPYLYGVLANIKMRIFKI